MFTREMQKFVNLSAWLLSGHSGAGNVALKMKRGAMGSSPSTSGGKKSPHLNADLTNKNCEYIVLEALAPVILLCVKIVDSVDQLQLIISNLLLIFRPVSRRLSNQLEHRNILIVKTSIIVHLSHC